MVKKLVSERMTKDTDNAEKEREPHCKIRAIIIGDSNTKLIKANLRVTETTHIATMEAFTLGQLDQFVNEHKQTMLNVEPCDMTILTLAHYCKLRNFRAVHIFVRFAQRISCAKI